jgi:peptidoglycan/xylan/chitin deacetylase (PgdA/CDA1 family)
MKACVLAFALWIPCGIQGAHAQESTGACGVQDGVFMHGSRQGRDIALTFDVCPTNGSPAFAPDLVAYLRDEGVPATFFVSGAWAEANPASLRELTGSASFEVALHGHRHPVFADAGPELVRAEITQGRDALLRMGIDPVPLFRPPYGDTPRGLSGIARDEGVLAVLFDTGLGDSDPNRSAEVMERDAIRWIQAGSVILLHANGRGYATHQTVRDLVPLLKRRGYNFVRVSDLVRACSVPAR